MRLILFSTLLLLSSCSGPNRGSQLEQRQNRTPRTDRIPVPELLEIPRLPGLGGQFVVGRRNGVPPEGISLEGAWRTAHIEWRVYPFTYEFVKIRCSISLNEGYVIHPLPLGSVFKILGVEIHRIESRHALSSVTFRTSSNVGRVGQNQVMNCSAYDFVGNDQAPRPRTLRLNDLQCLFDVTMRRPANEREDATNRAPECPYRYGQVHVFGQN